MEICIVGICKPGKVWWYSKGKLSFYLFFLWGWVQTRQEK